MMRMLCGIRYLLYKEQVAFRRASAYACANILRMEPRPQYISTCGCGCSATFTTCSNSASPQSSVCVHHTHTFE